MDRRKALVPFRYYRTDAMFRKFQLALFFASLFNRINLLIIVALVAVAYLITALLRVGKEEPVYFYTDGLLDSSVVNLIYQLCPDTVYVYVRKQAPSTAPIPTHTNDLTEAEVRFYAFTLTKVFEGCRYKLYPDGNGQSIGYGFYMHDSNRKKIRHLIGRNDFERTGLTATEADLVLRHFLSALIEVFKPRCADNRTLLAYVLKAYNRGVNGAVSNPFGCCGSRTTCGSADKNVKRSHAARRKVENLLRSRASLSNVKNIMDTLCKKKVQCR